MKLMEEWVIGNLRYLLLMIYHGYVFNKVSKSIIDKVDVLKSLANFSRLSIYTRVESCVDFEMIYEYPEDFEAHISVYDKEWESYVQTLLSSDKFELVYIYFNDELDDKLVNILDYKDVGNRLKLLDPSSSIFTLHADGTIDSMAKHFHGALGKVSEILNIVRLLANIYKIINIDLSRKLSTFLTTMFKDYNITSYTEEIEDEDGVFEMSLNISTEVNDVNLVKQFIEPFINDDRYISIHFLTPSQKGTHLVPFFKLGLLFSTVINKATYEAITDVRMTFEFDAPDSVVEVEEFLDEWFEKIVEDVVHIVETLEIINQIR